MLGYLYGCNKISLNFTQEQLETLESFFHFINWDFEETKVSDTKGVPSASCGMSTQTLIPIFLEKHKMTDPA